MQALGVVDLSDEPWQPCRDIRKSLIREPSRRTVLARNTAKKYLRWDEIEPTYAKQRRNLK